MTVLLSSAPFSMGSSSVDKKANVDMSLDDIIKARRTGSKDIKKRTNPKRNASSASTKKQVTANRATGAGKAKRSARLAAKRGLSDSNKPSPMEVQRETYRLNRSQRGGGNGNGGGNANRRNNKTVADQRIKAKNKKATTNNDKKANKNVPKKAVNIALQAMRNAGYNYDVPKGSKMVISFAPSSTPPSKPAPQKKNTNNNNNNRGRNNNRGSRR